MSWDQHTVLMMPLVTLRADISGEIRSLTTSFIADWKAVH